MIVVGHRGARGEAPENTIAGCRHAQARGVTRLEVDIRLSADDQLVVLHDNNLHRTTGLKQTVGKLTATELYRLDARAAGPPWPNKRQTGVPRLTALVKAVPAIEHWQLELKPGSDACNARLTDKVVQWLAAQDGKVPATDKTRKAVPGSPPGRFTITSSEPTLLTEIRRQRPGQSTGFVSTLVEPDMILTACACDYLVAHWSTLNPRLVQRVRESDVHISAWTVNDASVVHNLFDMGVDSVITDYPSMAVPLVSYLTQA